MTFVGKILVITIMAFALVFLALSTVVFSTSKNWMVATKTEQGKVEDLKKKLNDAKAASEAAKKGLEDVKAQVRSGEEGAREQPRLPGGRNQAKPRPDHDGPRAVGRRRANGQEYAWKKSRPRMNGPSSASHPAFGRREAGKRIQADQAELNDKIRDLTRQLETATKNNSTLRETVAKFSELLKKNGLSTDISQIKGLESPLR